MAEEVGVRDYVDRRTGKRYRVRVVEKGGRWKLSVTRFKNVGEGPRTCRTKALVTHWMVEADLALRASDAGAGYDIAGLLGLVVRWLKRK